MEADNLLLSLLGVVAEAIPGLHRIHQNVGRVRDGEGLAQGVVSAAQPCHGAGKAIQLIAASCEADSPAHLHRDPVFDAPSRDWNHSGQRIALEGPSALACRSCMGHRHAVYGHGYWRPVSRQPQLVAARIRHARIAAFRGSDLHPQHVAGLRRLDRRARKDAALVLDRGARVLINLIVGSLSRRQRPHIHNQWVNGFFTGVAHRRLHGHYRSGAQVHGRLLD